MAYNLIESYIYFYHTQNYIILPSMPESVSDSLTANFQQTSLLSRSAPIFTYSNSGPRSIQVSIRLHREMMDDLNNQNLNLTVELGDDYVDTLIKKIQACALPRYNSAEKLVDPPIIALRFGSEIFIKGVVSGNISLTYSGPILSSNKYAMVDISFNVSEIDPIDATVIQTLGSWRPIPRTLERNIYKS